MRDAERIVTRPGRLPATLALVLIVPAMLFAGCGGGGGEDEGPDTTASEFITQADAICSKADSENAAAAKAAFRGQQPTTEEAVAYITGEMVPALEAQLQQLRDLTPPDGDEDTVNAIWDGLEATIEEIKEDPEASLGVEDPLADVKPQAEAYGFKSCGVV